MAADKPPPKPHEQMPWEQAGDLTPARNPAERNRMRAEVLPASEPVFPMEDARVTGVVHELPIGAQTPQSVDVTMAVGIDLSVHEEAQAADEVTATITRFALPPDLGGDILKIADDIRSMVPLLRQLVDAQSRLGNNSAAATVRLPPDAPRIAELTASILDEEARSNQPRAHFIEQCLRVGDMLLRTALDAIMLIEYGVIANVISEAMMHPDETRLRMQTIRSTIEYVLTQLL
jgi:hypothetical protein